MNNVNQFSDILRTKLYRPRYSGDLVQRPHLIKRLDARGQRPLTLVSASAGYGKTTLISSWLETCETPSAWLSLDEQDDDLVTFLTYFIAAIQTMFPATCQNTMALLNAATLPPLPVLGRSLINELDQLEPAFKLVLDDFHFILDKAVYDLLNELLRYPPRPLHLVVITRHDPSMLVSTLRARGKMIEIRSRDLRFTAVETAALLQQMLGVELDEATVANLTRKTEGWVTGLCLSILSLRHRDDLDRLLRSLPENLHLHVADYLMAEVVSGQPPAIQEFLMKTSILDWLNGPLCDVVAELDEPECNGQAYLEWLHNANLFTLPLSDQQGSYRYHHLFQEHLQNQLKRRYKPEEIASMHTRASTWFAKTGLVGEALRHALAVGDATVAADLVTKHRHELMNQERWRLLERWQNLLPREDVEKKVKLLLTQAWLMASKFRYEEIPPILERVEIILGGENATLIVETARF